MKVTKQGNQAMNRRNRRATIRQRRQALQTIGLYLGMAVALPVAGFVAFIFGHAF
ncbi:hypothetical protein ACVDG5_018070 [Mesorhizobium sp. ORM6]